jgi:hypothetical protein
MYLTHLLVFESKTTGPTTPNATSSAMRHQVYCYPQSKLSKFRTIERIFNERLMSRTPCGNFIMSGDEVAMRIFGESVKLGSPVFILRGTGNCANQAALV